MKLIIAGSRPPLADRNSVSGTRRWYEQHRYVIEEAIAASPFRISEVEEIVSGKAKGIDRLAESFADRSRIPFHGFPADWDSFGKSAGFRRNGEMAKYADALLAISYGTPGIRNMIDQMMKLGKPTFVFDLRPTGAKPYPPARVVTGRTREPVRESRGPTIGRWEAGARRGSQSALTE